jgi:antirestriction protein ArdC
MDSNNSTSIKVDVYQIVTDRIIALLEAGSVPWQKPWTEAGVPMNLLSKRPYRGINFWLLMSLDYSRNLFVTWDQLKSIGASVKKNETGYVVVFWKNVKKLPEELDDQNKPKMVPLLRYYKVFNVDQCRDIPENFFTPLPPREHNPIAECESIIKKMPQVPPIKHKEQQAYYDIVKDFINMPKKTLFKDSESYYATLFHELVHSTGHEKRLKRKSITDMAEFGSDMYSLEELIAELGASYLSGYTGILNSGIVNSASYIGGWLTKLKSDKRSIVHASGFAQKAADFILNHSSITGNNETEQPESILED